MEECLFSTLEILRNEIKKIDDNIVRLIAQRVDIVRDIGKIKRQIDIPIKNSNVEHSNLTRLTNLANEMNISSKFINAIYTLVIGNAIQVQEEDRTLCQEKLGWTSNPDGLKTKETGQMGSNL